MMTAIDKKTEQTLEAQARKAHQYSVIKGAGFVKKLLRLRLLGLKYIRYSVARILPILSETTGVLFWGKKIRLPLSDPDARHLYYFGVLGPEELALTKFLLKNVRSSDIFYDIGASYGFYTYLAAEKITKGEIHAFEPHPFVFRYLAQNAEKKSTLLLQRLAISHKQGSAQLLGKPVGHHKGSSSSSLRKGVLNEAESSVIGEVETTTLDRYTANHNIPTLIKLDIEGGELDALKGGERFLRQSSPVLIMEIWRDARGKTFSEPAVAFLRGMGYRPHIINENGAIVPVDDVSFNIVQPNGTFQNLVFKKDS